jgi:ABC-2 type transport system ATP-binding protein
MKPSSLPPALDVNSVSHAYGARLALDNVSLRVESGEFCALLGLNGAGKSTLFALITRLFSSPRGSISILGHDINREPGEALRRIGVVFQSRTVDPDLTVLQNMTYHASLHGVSGRAARALATAALEQVALTDKAGTRVRELSGGQVRRAEIARALLHRPKLLLLDEPTVGLDVGSRRDIEAQVRALADRDGLGVLWATHIMEEVSPQDKAVVLHRGRVLAQGTATTVIAQAGGANLTEAFTKLTGADAASPAEAA